MLKMVGSILEVVLVKLIFSSPDNRFPLPWYLQKLGWLVYIPAYSISFDRDYFSTLMEHSLRLHADMKQNLGTHLRPVEFFDFFLGKGVIYFNEVILVGCFPFSSPDPREVGRRTLFFKIPVSRLCRVSTRPPCKWIAF